MVIMMMSIILLLVLLCYTNGFKIPFNNNKKMNNNVNASSNKSRVISRAVSPNIKKITSPKAVTRSSKDDTNNINSSSSSKKRQSIFNIFGILGRLGALEDAITEMKADMKELKYSIVFFGTIFIISNQWDKSVIRSDIKNDMAIMREERRQDKEETKKDMAIMRDEMQRNFYITTAIALVPLVSPFLTSIKNNDSGSSK